MNSGVCEAGRDAAVGAGVHRMGPGGLQGQQQFTLPVYFWLKSVYFLKLLKLFFLYNLRQFVLSVLHELLEVGAYLFD